jgi:formylglycine-generating enzyme required for sulfatase activity
LREILAEDSTFLMGDSIERESQPIHPVKLTHDFFMDTTEVTEADYLMVTGGKLDIIKGNNYPASGISWVDAMLYCNKKSKKENLDTVYSYDSIINNDKVWPVIKNFAANMEKNGYQLPTEAQWEYTCRGGIKTRFYWNNGNMDDFCWYEKNSNGTTHPVAQKLPNSFGLYDMSGNVQELCADWSDYYVDTLQIDPFMQKGSNKITRGGCCTSNLIDKPYGLASGSRNIFWHPETGFRCIRLIH